MPLYTLTIFLEIYTKPSGKEHSGATVLLPQKRCSCSKRMFRRNFASCNGSIRKTLGSAVFSYGRRNEAAGLDAM